LYKYNK